MASTVVNLILRLNVVTNGILLTYMMSILSVTCLFFSRTPPSVLEKNKHVTLSIDIMYVNRIPFMTTFSRNIKLTTVKAIQNRTKYQLVQSIKNVLPIYTQRGLQVDNALLDGEFVPLRTDLLTLGINPNLATCNEHVPEIERQHRMIK